MGIHALLVAGLIFLSWEKPAPKLEMPPIKITHIKLEQKKAITPNVQIQPTAMVTNTVPSFPVKVKQSQKPPLTNFSPTQSAPIHTAQRSLTIPTHTARPRPTPSYINELDKPLIPIAANALNFSVHSYSNPTLNKEATARTVTEELSSTPLKASPAPGMQIVERWIPVSKIHPVQVASIPSDFVDENSKSTSLASVADKPGHPAGKTDSSGQDLNAIRKGFSSSVRDKIAQAKYYPPLARKRGWEGKAIVEFKLARNGDLLSSTITLTSPHKILNDAALDTIKNAAPYPKIPKTLKMDSIRFKFPISFILDGP